jgi:hypothetical protein
MNIGDKLREILLSEARNTYKADLSNDSLEGEMYDAQGEMQQFISGGEDYSLLFGEYGKPVDFKISDIVTPQQIKDIKNLIYDRQGKWGKKIVKSLINAMKRGDKIPPITVWRESKDKYRLISGRHRLLASIKMGYEYMPTIVMYWRDKEDLYESSKPNILSEIEDELDLSAFKVNDKLNPDIWVDDDTIREDIQRRLLKIAYDYWESLEMGYDYDDVTFTGSLANYNWSNYSDIDLHIVFDFRKLGSNSDKIKELIDSKTRNWNSEHDITIKGFDVELYIQDKREPHHSTGVYSLLKDKWLKKPIKDVIELNRPHIEEKYNNITALVKDIQKDYKSGNDMEAIVKRVKRLKDRLRKMRKSGLETGGEFSTENIVYKILRRQNIMKQLSDIEKSAYDQSVTLENVEPTDEEPTGNKRVSLRYVEGLLKNVYQSASRKMLGKWITRTKKNNSDFVDLSPREHEIYVLIKNQGGFKPEDFSSKNYPIKKL